jgi:hypothetical protein
MTQWIGFLPPPPPLYYGQKDMFWVGLATLCSGLVCALVSLLFPTKEKNSTKMLKVLAALALVVLLVLICISIAYNQRRSKWTFSLQGESVPVLMGDRYKSAALADSKTPGIDKQTLFMDFGLKSSDVWTESGLRRRQLRLGIIYLSASVAGGVCFSLAAWIVITFTSRAWRTQAGGRAPQRKPEHLSRRSRSGRKKNR